MNDRRRPVRIGVLIPAYNEQANLGKLLNFLRLYERASVHAPLEVQAWVDVSGSTDHTREIAEEYASRWRAIHVVDTGQRDGLVRALDRMIQVAEGDLFLRMDADVSLTSETLDGMLKVLLESGASIVGPQIVPGSSPSRIVNRLSRAEYRLHHRVCLKEPKTTLVQLFRAIRVHLPPDSLDDTELQGQVVARGGPAAYAPESIVTIVPPTNLRDFLFQRVRTIQHLNMHRRRGYTSTSTGDLRLVGGSVAEELAAGRDQVDTLGFLAAEALARLAARWLTFVGADRPFQWRPIDDTKAPAWAVALPGATRPSEEPVPMLSR